MIASVLLLISKIGSVRVSLDDIVNGILDTIESSDFGVRIVPPIGKMKKEELTVLTVQTEFFLLKVLDFQISCFYKSSVDNLLLFSRLFKFSQNFTEKAVAVLNDIQLLQQSHCFSEKHLAAVASLFVLGSSNEPSPKGPWWRAFGMKSWDLALISSLIVPDLVEFSRETEVNLGTFRTDFKRTFKKVTEGSLRENLDVSVSETLSINEEKASFHKAIDLGVYASETFKRRDNRFINGQELPELRPKLISNKDVYDKDDQFPVENESENGEPMMDFGPKQFSEGSLLSKNDNQSSEHKLSKAEAGLNVLTFQIDKKNELPLSKKHTNSNKSVGSYDSSDLKSSSDGVMSKHSK